MPEKPSTNKMVSGGKRVKSLFSKAWTALTNPAHEEKVQQIVTAIGTGLNAQRQNFNLERILEPIDCVQADVDVAINRYLEQFIERYWKNGIPTTRQVGTAKWVAGKLGIQSKVCDNIMHRFAEETFAVHLRDCLADGVLEPSEIDMLTAIAATCDQSLNVFVEQSFADHGVELMGEVLCEAVKTGTLDKKAWTNLKACLITLGIDSEKLLAVANNVIPGFAEHIIADAKSVEQIDAEQVEYLNWLCEEFKLSPHMKEYVREEIDLLQKIMAIRSGHVPPLPRPKGVNFSSGEILYFTSQAILVYYRKSRGELVPQRCSGVFLLTDHRLLFQSLEKPLSLKLSSCLTYLCDEKALHCEFSGKPAFFFAFTEPPPATMATIETVFQLHNQSLVRSTNGQAPDRHIPREIRQRVWQAYGGRCVECGATEYLEYDHIVPVAKGGSNGENNIQLLCRKCNLKKSDKI